jgi:hypothetical protein
VLVFHIDREHRLKVVEDRGLEIIFVPEKGT